MTEVTERSDRATEEWEVVINPFPLFGEVLFMLYFKHREQPYKFFHRHYKTIHDAQQEQRRLNRDLRDLRLDKFLEKYRIGYDLKGSIL
jgi:hypothetical protein